MEKIVRVFSSTRVVSSVRCRVVRKLFGVEVGVVFPHGPEGFEDFSLGVESGVADACALFTGFVEVSDAATLRTYADAGAPGVIGDIFEFALAAAVDALVAKGLVVAVSGDDS